MRLTILNECLGAVQIGFKNQQCLRIRVRGSIEPTMAVRFRPQKRENYLCQFLTLSVRLEGEQL